MVRAPPISVVIPGHLWPSWSYLVVLIILAHFGHSLSFWPWVIIRDVVIITLIRGYPWPFVVLLVLRGHAGHPWSPMVGPVIPGHSGHSGRSRLSCSLSSFMIMSGILMIRAHSGHSLSCRVIVNISFRICSHADIPPKTASSEVPTFICTRSFARVCVGVSRSAVSERGSATPWHTLSLQSTAARDSTAEVFETSAQAAIAQLGERQTEDLKVPSAIPGHGMLSVYLLRLYPWRSYGDGHKQI